MSGDQNDGALDEQTFFEDTALDRAFGVVMALAAEVYVQRDRIRALERLLERNGVLDRTELDAEPSPEELAADEADRRAFTAGLLENLLGKQASKGAP